MMMYIGVFYCQIHCTVFSLLINKRLQLLKVMVHGCAQIAETWDATDSWVDAVRLVYTIYAQGKKDVLAGVLVG
jgi:hypothetical protein